MNRGQPDGKSEDAAKAFSRQALGVFRVLAWIHSSATCCEWLRNPKDGHGLSWVSGNSFNWGSLGILDPPVCDLLFALGPYCGRIESMVETLTFVGIYVWQSAQTRVSERCEMDGFCLSTGVG